jgi:hypothetical protein
MGEEAACADRGGSALLQARGRPPGDAFLAMTEAVTTTTATARPPGGPGRSCSTRSCATSGSAAVGSCSLSGSASCSASSRTWSRRTRTLNFLEHRETVNRPAGGDRDGRAADAARRRRRGQRRAERGRSKPPVDPGLAARAHRRQAPRGTPHSGSPRS